MDYETGELRGHAKLFASKGFMLRSTVEGITLEHINSQKVVRITRDCMGLLPAGLFKQDYKAVSIYARENWEVLLMASSPRLKGRLANDRDYGPDDESLEGYCAAKDEFREDAHNFLDRLLAYGCTLYAAFWNTAYEYCLDCMSPTEAPESYEEAVQLAMDQAFANSPFRVQMSFL